MAAKTHRVLPGFGLALGYTLVYLSILILLPLGGMVLKASELGFGQIMDIALGEHVHVNIGCSVSHDVRIDDFSTLSPGVHVSGHVKIGRDVFIGTGANIINGSAASPLVIGDGALIAAGACVTKSVEAGSLVAGVPAVRKK